MFFRTPYKNPPPRCKTVFKEPSMTQQHFAFEADINNVMLRYSKTGVLPQYAGAAFADVSSVSDYYDFLQQQAVIEDSFAALPAKLRARFSNSPELLLDFISNPDNLAEARALGLLPDEPKPAASQEPAPADVQPQPSPAPPSGSLKTDVNPS